MSNTIKLPEMLRELMDEHNLTPAQLAIETTLPIANIYEYLSGANTPFFENFIFTSQPSISRVPRDLRAFSRAK